MYRLYKPPAESKNFYFAAVLFLPSISIAQQLFTVSCQVVPMPTRISKSTRTQYQLVPEEDLSGLNWVYTLTYLKRVTNFNSWPYINGKNGQGRLSPKSDGASYPFLLSLPSLLHSLLSIPIPAFPDPVPFCSFPPCHKAASLHM